MSTAVEPTVSNSSTAVAALADWIDRNRRVWFALVAVVLALSFNGQWHLGPDSAGYRQLAHNLAAHGHYFFRNDIPGVDQYHNEQGTRYPGLPILLAGIEKLAGKSPLPPLILMMAMAVLSLVLIYRVLLYRLPRWLVVCVVVGVGTNERFLQYANEILSDMPFLLGVLVTMLGFEWLLRAKCRVGLLKAILCTFLGLLFAAAMRPTFLLLGAAILITCLWGILRGKVSVGSSPDTHEPARGAVRWRSAMLVGAFALATILFVSLIDIRARQGGFLNGGYEERMMSKARNFDSKVEPLLSFNIGELLEDVLPMAILGYRSGWGVVPMGRHHLGFGATFSIIILISGVLLARRNLLWGSFVAVTIGALLFAGPVPRYFLMLLPMLLAGWGLSVRWMAGKAKSPAVARFIFGFGLFFLLVSNVVASFTFVLTQRGFTKAFDAHRHWSGIHYVGFLRAYDFGRWIGFDELGRRVHQATSPRDQLVGPDASVLTFLSDRQVYEPILGNRTKAAGKLLNLAIFPMDTEWHQSKEEYPQELKQFLRTLHKQEGERITTPAANYQLARLTKLPAHRLTAAQRLEHARRMAAHRDAAARAKAKTAP
jgi:hypothetical protein